MAAGDIYRKTARGAAEISQRKLKLNPRLRTMLILVDGVQPEFILKEEAGKIGAPPDFLQQLVATGLIERAAGSPVAAAPGPAAAAQATTDPFLRFRETKNFMNTTVVDALGIRSFFFTLKLEKAATLDDLRALVEPYEEAMAKADETQAQVLIARLRDMLA